MRDDSDTDELQASRKQDHIELAFRSRIEAGDIDERFYYEPIITAHPTTQDLKTDFLGKPFKFPVWVSSMTGGTERAKSINEKLARLCADFELGMGLGSCRALLHSNDRFPDFNLRPILGNDRPFYANLGIAQIEEIISNKATDKIKRLIENLKADGLIIHINPLQEWAQPEGDSINRTPLETITELCNHLDCSIIVKEVGQGMGPKSLKQLMKLPLDAIEFGAAGGTNFTRLELNRSERSTQYKDSISHIGHTADEMIEFVNNNLNDSDVRCKEFIISGGVTNYLQGYYLMEKCAGNSIYGQASAFLKPALTGYDDLAEYFQSQMDGLMMANAYLHVRKK